MSIELIENLGLWNMLHQLFPTIVRRLKGSLWASIKMLPINTDSNYRLVFKYCFKYKGTCNILLQKFWFWLSFKTMKNNLTENFDWISRQNLRFTFSNPMWTCWKSFPNIPRWSSRKCLKKSTKKQISKFLSPSTRMCENFLGGPRFIMWIWFLLASISHLYI